MPSRLTILGNQRWQTTEELVKLARSDRYFEGCTTSFLTADVDGNTEGLIAALRQIFSRCEQRQPKNAEGKRRAEAFMETTRARIEKALQAANA